MRFIEVRFRPPPDIRHPVVGALSDSDHRFREELLRWNTEMGTRMTQLLRVSGDMRVYRNALARVETIHSFELMDSTNQWFYAYIEEIPDPDDVPWWDAFRERDFVYIPPIVFEDEEVFLTLLGDPDELQQILDAFPDPVRVDVEHIGEFRGPHGTVVSRLTDRQLEAIEIAYELGYFEVPRQTSLARVAEALDCTESTASTLVRNAEQTLIRAVLDK